MKGILGSVTGPLRAKLAQFRAQRKEIDSNIYKLERAIADLNEIESLKRHKKIGTRRSTKDRQIRRCPQCGKEFEFTHPKATYCSGKCRQRFLRKGTTLIKGDDLRSSKSAQGHA